VHITYCDSTCNYVIYSASLHNLTTESAQVSKLVIGQASSAVKK